jgi:transcriptional regulator with XRE-family HTH domain
MTVNQRISEVLTILGITQAAFCEKTGINRPTVNTVLKGINAPSFMVVESILRNFPNLNPNWLILGNGEIWINEFDNLNNQIITAKKSNGKKNQGSLETSNEKEFLQKIIMDKDSHIADLRRTIALLEKNLAKS